MPDTLRAPAARGVDPATWYNPGKSIREFHASQARVKALIGARGAAKTTASGVEAVDHCVNNSGARVLCCRKTSVSAEDTAVKTFMDVYANMGFAVDIDQEASLFRVWNNGLSVRIPSREAIEEYNKFQPHSRTKQEIKAWIENVGDRLCSHIEFRGLRDAQKAQGQFRSFECSMLVFIEADELDEEDLNLGIACLRWKNAHGEYFDRYGVILETNPPDPTHWIALMEERTKQDPDYAFWHIPTRENAHNLRPGYIEDLESQYADKPAHRRRYLLGEYAVLFDGQPVYHAFDQYRHAYSSLPWPKGAYLVVGWDFGATHANSFSAYFKIDYRIGDRIKPVEYWWVLHEYFSEYSTTDQQCEAVRHIIETEFPFYNDRSLCSGVMHFCDPAGASKTDKGRSIDVLTSWDFHAQYSYNIRSLDTSIAIMNRLFKLRDPAGRHCFRIDKNHAQRIYRALAGEYRFPRQGEPGFATGTPIKGPAANGADHLSDSLRYSVLNAMHLAKVEGDALKPSTGPIGNRRRSLNRKKRF